MTGRTEDIAEQVGAFFELEREVMREPILVTREMWLKFLKETRPNAFLLAVAGLRASAMFPGRLYMGEPRD